MKVSIFDDAFSGTPRTTTLASVVTDIQSGLYAKQIETLRDLLASGNKPAYDRKKKSLPAFTLSGTCYDRKTIASHSGLIQADLDNLNGSLDVLRDKLHADPHIVAGFVSPSGNGLKLAVRVPAIAGRHCENFEAVERYFRTTYELQIDPACKDPLRLCFVSNDPEAWLNEQAIEFDAEQWRSTAELDVLPELSIYDGLVERYGLPYSANVKGGIQINQMFFVARFAVEHLVLHEPNERDFYTYEHLCGAWRPRTTDAIKAMMSEDWQRYARDVDKPALVPLRTNGLLDSLTSLLRGHVEKAEAFTRAGRVIHLVNGMLHLDHEGADLREFSPDYYSRNVCPIPWDADADCPRFKSELLAKALDREDISLLQRWCGSLLLGRNLAQKIMLLTGTPGGGRALSLRSLRPSLGHATYVSSAQNTWANDSSYHGSCEKQCSPVRT